MEEEKQTTSAASAPSAGMLGALLSNPDLLRRVGSIIGSMTQNEEPKSTDAPPTENSQNAVPTSAVPASTSDVPVAVPTGGLPTDGLSAVLSDPAMLEKLPQIMAVMKPMLASMSSPKEHSAPPPSSPDLCRDHLLLALKPFLSPARCEAVDSIIRISKLGSVFKQLK